MEKVEAAWNWLSSHIPEILGVAGVGGGSGLLGKKLIDKEQSKKITELEGKVEVHDKLIMELQAEIKSNTLLDEAFRTQISDQNKQINSKIDELGRSIAEGQKNMMNELLTIYKNKLGG